MALRFNRPFQFPIKALSFDLDDTLYYNETVIQHAEQAQFDAICELVSDAKEAGMEPWIALKWQVLKQHKDQCHDVTWWRKTVIRTGLAQYNLTPSQLNDMTERVFERFYDARSDFTVPQKTFDILTVLAEKWPLVAVTNGNADVNRIGLAPYFVGYYRAGENGTRMKPAPDLLIHAAKDLDIEPKHILHIGDNATADIGAALNAGCQSLWFNPNKQLNPKSYLADGEYSDLADLLQLV